MATFTCARTFLRDYFIHDVYTSFSTGIFSFFISKVHIKKNRKRKLTEFFFMNFGKKARKNTEKKPEKNTEEKLEEKPV